MSDWQKIMDSYFRNFSGKKYEDFLYKLQKDISRKAFIKCVTIVKLPDKILTQHIFKSETMSKNVVLSQYTVYQSILLQHSTRITTFFQILKIRLPICKIAN